MPSLLGIGTYAGSVVTMECASVGHVVPRALAAGGVCGGSGGQAFVLLGRDVSAIMMEVPGLLTVMVSTVEELLTVDAALGIPLAVDARQGGMCGTALTVKGCDDVGDR